MSTGVRSVGDFCWFNMLTPHPPAAREFFSALLGWSYGEIPGMGHSIVVDGKSVGGIFDVSGPNTPAGMQPQLGIMIKVESADDAVKRVVELGGTAMSAFDVMQQGRMAVCHDPNGAQFDVWEGRNSPGMDVDSKAIGAPSWIENMTTDADRAKQFYTEMFGWVAGQMPMPLFTYTNFQLNGVDVAGMYPIQPDMGAMPPRWDVYFTVQNADESLALAEKLGARICIPGQDIPNIGRFGGIVSPQGVMFYIIQYV